MNQFSKLLLPGDPGFNETLASPPPGIQNTNYVVRPGSMLMEAVTEAELREYLLSGEYADRTGEIEAEIPTNEGLASDVLILPTSISFE